MNIKDSYLHGGTHVVKDISFSIPASGTNKDKLVATITWASQTNGVDDTTELPITLAGSIFGSLTKNYALAAPSNANGNPTFRALVAADIPKTLDASHINSGTLVAARLPLATNSERGAIILGVAQDDTTNITGKLYWVKMNANGKIYVDIPWLNNTHYTAIPVLGSSTATSNATSDTANNETYLNIIENSAKSGGIKITGDGTGTTVKAKDGILTITSKWQAATSAQVGYAPKLVSGGTALADSSNDYILAFTYASSGTLSPTWKKLPANAYLNTWRGIQDNLTSSENTTESLSAKQGYLLANGSARDDTKLPLEGGTMTGALKRYYSAASNDPMIAMTTNNQDIWLWRINHGSSALTSTSAVYGFGLKYIGSRQGMDNNLVLYADNSIGTQVAAMTMDLTGKITLAVTPNVNGTNVSLVGHRHAYTDLTGSTATADQVIVSSGTANGWTLKTLGSRAFDNTAYVPVAGNVTMTGPLGMTCTGSAANISLGINFNNSGSIIAHVGTSTGIGIYTTGNIYLRSNCTLNNGTFTANTGLEISSTVFTYNGNTVYHSGNIPSNTKDAAGIVAKGVASSVYMTDSTGAPAWTAFDTAVIDGSGHLVTSGAVYSAIASSVAGAVQYLGTVASEAAMTALTNAGKGDFARVTTSFTFTDATGASVTAHVGDVVYLTNNTPGTASNWIVAHTEIDTNTWTAASTSAAGYIPALATGGAALASSTNDYVLAFVNGTNTTPVWRKLPANAYKNDNTTGVKLVSSISGTKKTDTTLIKIASGTGLSIMGGTNKFTIGDGTNYIEVAVAHDLSTKNLNVNGTDYAIYTSSGSLPSIKAPTEYGNAGQILATNSNANGLAWISDGDITPYKLAKLYFTKADDTVGSYKAGIISWMDNDTSGTIGLHITFSADLLTDSKWNNDSATVDGSFQISMIKIGGGYNNSNNGLWLLSGYGDKQLKVIGRSYNEWTDIKTLAYTSDIPTLYNLVFNNGSSDVFTFDPDSATKKIIKGANISFTVSGNNLTISSTDTNDKVTQTLTTSNSTNFRPLIVGNSSSVNASPTFEAVTASVYATTTMYVKPSTGDFYTSGKGTFAGVYSSAGFTSTSGDLNFNSTNNIVWNAGSIQERIAIVDNSDDTVDVFRFQRSKDTGTNWYNLMTIKGNGTVTATIFVGELTGNATTATDLDKTSATTKIGYLYQSGNTTTACTGVGSVSAATEIGIPYIGYSGSANTYGIYKDLFYLSSSTKYISTSVHSVKFACVKTQNSTTDDWDGSTTSGTSAGGGTTYSAGDGISISGTTISTTNKEWYGTEAQFNALTSLNSNTTYYITAD